MCCYCNKGLAQSPQPKPTSDARLLPHQQHPQPSVIPCNTVLAHTPNLKPQPIFLTTHLLPITCQQLLVLQRSPKFLKSGSSQCVKKGNGELPSSISIFHVFVDLNQNSWTKTTGTCSWDRLFFFPPCSNCSPLDVFGAVLALDSLSYHRHYRAAVELTSWGGISWDATNQAELWRLCPKRNRKIQGTPLALREKFRRVGCSCLCSSHAHGFDAYEGFRHRGVCGSLQNWKQFCLLRICVCGMTAVPALGNQTSIIPFLSRAPTAF